MQEQSRLIPGLEEIQNSESRRQVQVEGAIDEFKVANAAIQEFLKLIEQGGQWKEPDGRIASG
jgi:hypothetical protein